MWKLLILIGFTMFVNAQLSNRMNTDSCVHCTQTDGFFVDLNQSLVSINMAVKFPEGFYCQYNMNYEMRWIFLVGFDSPMACKKGEYTYYLAHSGKSLDILATIKFQIHQLSIDMDDTNCTRYVRSGYTTPILAPMKRVEPFNYNAIPSGRRNWNTLEALLNYFRPSQRNIPIMTMEAAAIANPVLLPLLSISTAVNSSVVPVNSSGSSATPTAIPPMKSAVPVTPKFIIPHMESDE